MFYELKLTKAFKKGYKLAEKRGLNTDLLDEIVEKLQNDITLDGGIHNGEQASDKGDLCMGKKSYV